MMQDDEASKSSQLNLQCTFKANWEPIQVWGKVMLSIKTSLEKVIAWKAPVLLPRGSKTFYVGGK